MIDPIEPGTEPSAASTHSAEKSAAHTPGKDDVEVDVDHKAVASIEPYQSRTVDSEKGVSTEDAVVALPGEEVASADEAYTLAGEVATSFTDAEARAVRTKCDLRVLPLLAMVYFSQYLDKLLISWASITGLPITGDQYSTASAGFYYGFLACAIPQSIMAQKFDPAKYLGVNVVIWGIVVACHATATSFGPFFACRFLLGGLESCVAPTLIMTVSAFYPKKEQGMRIASFYMCNGLTSMIGPLIAYATTFYSGAGLGGKNDAWKLLYIVFGCAAFLVGLLVLCFLPASPSNARWLSPREKRVALERIRGNSSGTVQKSWKLYQVKDAFTDVKVGLLLILTLLTSIPNGGLSSFSSLIIKQIGYTTRQTLLVQIPMGAVGVAFTVGSTYLSDRYRERILPAIICVTPTFVGAAILVGFGEHSKAHKGAALFAVYLCQSFGSSLALIYAWLATNIGGSSKKQVCTYANAIFFAVGNIAGSYVFTGASAPVYIPGKIAVMVTLIIAVGVIVALRFTVAWQQRGKKREIERLMSEHGWTEEDVTRQREKMAFRDQTDRENPYYVYIS